MMIEFRNESLVDFSQMENVKRMEEAIARISANFGDEHDLIIGGKRVKAEETFESRNPSNIDELIGVFQKATKKEAEMAIEAALEAFKSWKWHSARERACFLFRTATLLRQRRFDLSAMMVLEEGKSWVEADADTAEAIDFCEFYGREMIRLAAPQPVTPYPGEFPEVKYIPLGVGAIIPPWNFPCAILVGMTMAAVVSGNTVVLKPASDSPGIATLFMDILIEAGLPPGVVNLLTGPGRLAGEALVTHPKIRFISFTGSREVGLRINELAAKTMPGQIWIKRVIAEMGGKDFIIVDQDCDLDEAVAAVSAGAFGFQGQKCSACSRAIVLQSVYQQFMEKLLASVETITIGDVRQQKNYLGPVINEAARQKILKYIEVGAQQARLAAGGGRAEGNGYFIQPTVIADVKPDDTIAQEEIFGPVLAVIPVADIDQAIEVANGTVYGLTGALYSRNRDHIRQGKRQLHVGNLYINRKCTGALVGVHPFGGFNMSGTDSKAGGRDYLVLFSQAKSISEKV